MFYSFDGIDGGGKSTQLKLFCDWLAERGEPVRHLPRSWQHAAGRSGAQVCC